MTTHTATEQSQFEITYCQHFHTLEMYELDYVEFDIQKTVHCDIFL